MPQTPFPTVGKGFAPFQKIPASHHKLHRNCGRAPFGLTFTIEWIMDQYRVKVDPDSGIRSDPNAWCREHNDPAYILNLLKRVIRVSMETNRIVANFPSLELERTSA